MISNIRYLVGMLVMLMLPTLIIAQNIIDCDPNAGIDITEGEVIFNYGSTTNSISFKNKTSHTVGQPLVGGSLGQVYTSEYGYWSRFLLPPFAPSVNASQGDFPDRNLITWNLGPLSPEATQGFVITRDGAYLGQVDPGINQFIDFNVQPGEVYSYGVYGKNDYGNGSVSTSLGFVNPNGVVAGRVTTFSGNPVVGATVTLTPLTGQALSFDGTDDKVCISFDEALLLPMFTASAHVKIGDNYANRAILDMGSDSINNFWIHTSDGVDGKGVAVSVGDGSTAYTLTHTFDSDPDAWHQVSLAYAANQMLLYIDGEFKASQAANIAIDSSRLSIGSTVNDDQFFDGNIDDVRIFNSVKSSSDIFLDVNHSPSANASDLVAYFSFDEGMGKNVFDLSQNKLKGEIFGAVYSADYPQIKSVGQTDQGGNYIIPGINYSSNQNFTVAPSKIFYDNGSAEFNKAFESYIDLTDFDLKDTFTIELTAQPFNIIDKQSLLSYGDDFDLYVENGMYYLALGMNAELLGPASMTYEHIAVTFENGSIQYYLNGNLVKTYNASSSTADFMGDNWRLGAKGSTTIKTQYFTGLIDEVAFFSEVLTIQQIQLHASTVSDGVSIGDGNLMSIFLLDEDDFTEVFDAGPAMTGLGIGSNVKPSILCLRQGERPHVFSPNSRSFIVSASNTSISGMDFTDESTVTVSGVVRFENTFCFQDSVEILVDGESTLPKTYTDANGKFVIDFEPGESPKLSPSFGSENKEHEFAPAFFEARNISRPIASVLFSNKTKRKIKGRVSGGDGRLNVNHDGDLVRMKVAALNQCYEEELTLDNAEGNFEFVELPAVVFATSMTFNENTNIYEYFQEAGGKESDMRDKEVDTLDFRYYKSPEVWMEPFEDGMCPSGGTTPYPYVEESGPDNGFKIYKKTVRMFEEYAGGVDWLENYNLVFTNNLNDETQGDTIAVRDTTAYEYEFVAGQANISGDFTKFLQVVGINMRGENDSEIQRAVVLGEREREATFATTAPTVPLLILRDPPGDGSSATWEKGATYCNTWSNVRARKAGGGISESLKLGTDIEFSTGLGVSKTTKIELENTLSVSATFETSETSTRESNFCMTANQTISTSDSDAVPGDGGDIYYGAALNLKFSGNDVLYLDTTTCTFSSDSVTVSISPEGFETEYIYSEWQLKTSIISNLELIGDIASANAWRNIIAYNEYLKSNGQIDKNISFDGLASYSETKQVEQSSSNSLEVGVSDNGTIANEFGYEVDGFGYGLNLNFEFGNSSTTTTTSSNTATSTVSYTLADDDPNDSYTIDVFNDPVMSTPYFRLVAGESMCPWIPGTLNREEIGFQIDKLTALNVPENEAATFSVTMSNNGQTGNDPLVYIIGLKQGSNPNGAVLTIDGEALINPIPIQLQPGESKTFLLAVEKGPDVNIYNYYDIGIFAASECQYQHALGLGYNLAGYADWEVNNPGEAVPIESDGVMEGIYNIVDLQKFYQQFLINVEFQEPCSSVDLGFPLQDWVQTPAQGDNLTIVIDNYNNGDPELDLIRVQYRRTGGDGSWINITEVPKADLTDPISHTVTWDMSQLADGPYEIRALAICTSGLNPGISTVMKGRKETNPPLVFGVPEPADGILSPGDEISIEFSKRINCNKVFQADGIGTNINLNNIALQDMTLGGVLIDATITCKDEKIFIVPNIANQFIENHTLRATATGIEDLYGNAAEQVVWEFFVNRSNLYWVGGNVEEVVLEGESKVVTREIRNQSGENTNFQIYDIPNWMDVFPYTGSIPPGESKVITLEFPSDLIIASYEQNLNLSEIVGSSITPTDGIEALEVDLRVTCPSPDWNINASDYDFSMNYVLELNIEGELSSDKVDQVAAFVGNELRGIANVEYDAILDRWFAFLTVYSNQGSGETVEFQIWDASLCQLYANIVESFPFAADGLIGSPNVPQTIHTDGQVLRMINIHPGWNWISFNVSFPDPNINNVLTSLSSPTGGLIKDQTTFSSYSEGASSWFGSLNNLGFTSLYQYNSEVYDSLSIIGFPVDASTELPLVNGWNWISYLPQIGLPIDQALASLEPLNGDLIKGQLQFAVYVAGTGWVGNLDFLSPPNGYLIKLSNVDTLVYPSAENFAQNEPTLSDLSQMVQIDQTYTSIDVLKEHEKPFSHWTVDATLYENSMNMIAIVLNKEGDDVLSDGDEVAAFFNDEIRGSTKVTYIEELDAYLLFLTVYGHQNGEVLTFKYFDNQENMEHVLSDEHMFLINDLVGTIDNPYPFTLSSITNTEEVDIEDFNLWPNPFTNVLHIDYDANANTELVLSIKDALGNLVYSSTQKVAYGVNNIQWIPDASLAFGIYTISINDGQRQTVKKVLFIK